VIWLEDKQAFEDRHMSRPGFSHCSGKDCTDCYVWLVAIHVLVSELVLDCLRTADFPLTTTNQAVVSSVAMVKAQLWSCLRIAQRKRVNPHKRKQGARARPDVNFVSAFEQRMPSMKLESHISARLLPVA
jgi:hypothetical protein